MDTEKQQLNNFLKEGEEWFKESHFPKFFPAFVAQIPDAINKFSESVKIQAESSENLSRSITRATWVVACSAVVTIALTLFYR